jgi:hypothetical protein
VARKFFDEIAVNIGRRAGLLLAGIAHYTERDAKPQEQYKVERHGKYRIIRINFSLGPAGFKIEIERQPSVKEIHKMS